MMSVNSENTANENTNQDGTNVNGTPIPNAEPLGTAPASQPPAEPLGPSTEQPTTAPLGAVPGEEMKGTGGIDQAPELPAATGPGNGGLDQAPTVGSNVDEAVVSTTNQEGTQDQEEKDAAVRAMVPSAAEIMERIRSMRDEYAKAKEYVLDRELTRFLTEGDDGKPGKPGPIAIMIGTGEEIIYVGEKRLIAFNLFPVIRYNEADPITYRDEDGVSQYYTQEEKYERIMKSNYF